MLDALLVCVTAVCVVLTLSLPDASEQTYLFTNLLFLLPSARAYTFRLLDLAVMFSALVVVSGGWHLSKTAAWRDLDSIYTRFLLFHLSLRVLPYLDVKLVYVVSLLEALLAYYFLDVWMYIHLGGVCLVAVESRLLNRYIVVAAIMMGAGWAIASLGTHRMHALWHSCAAVSLYVALYSVRDTTPRPLVTAHKLPTALRL